MWERACDLEREKEIKCFSGFPRSRLGRGNAVLFLGGLEGAGIAVVVAGVALRDL